jgi:hypothetical protein
MPEETWHTARLIPTSGISGADEQERRAVSALLAVISAVKEYGRAVLAPLGAPNGALECYIEVPFDLQDGRNVRPDGLIEVHRGQRNWTALVEVKTGTNTLMPDQLNDYLDIARDKGFDVVLTISNEIPPAPGVHPTAGIDKRKLKKVALHHVSWSELLAAAQLQKEHRGVADPDQAWILGELIRYLEHPRSGALEFNDMGSAWVEVRNAVSAGTLRPSDKGAPQVAGRFDGLLRYTALQLGRQLGTDVQVGLSRKELADPALRASTLTAELVNSGTMTGSLRIPNTAGSVTVIADLRANNVVCHLDVDAPKDGRPTTRVNWLLRQLKSASDNLRLESTAAHTRGAGAAELLSVVRADPTKLVLDPTKELKSFRLAMTFPMGTKRGTGRGAFIDSVTEAVDVFYRDVVQGLKVWAPAAPRLRELPPEVPTSGFAAVLASTALSSQDEEPELVAVATGSGEGKDDL